MFFGFSDADYFNAFFEFLNFFWNVVLAPGLCMIFQGLATNVLWLRSCFIFVTPVPLFVDRVFPLCRDMALAVSKLWH